MKTWSRLGTILSRLPTTSQFVKDTRLDPEVADQALAEQEARRNKRVPPRKWRPDLAEWGAAEELLALVADRIEHLSVLIANLPATMNGKRGKNKPGPAYPRPRTAIEEAERRRRVRMFEELDADVREAQERWRQLQAGTAS